MAIDVEWATCDYGAYWSTADLLQALQLMQRKRIVSKTLHIGNIKFVLSTTISLIGMSNGNAAYGDWACGKASHQKRCDGNGRVKIEPAIAY